ncbi:MAG: hypothetical protein RL264_1763 [Bacteroidota bacterium]|jgi:hypothetical protein
MKKLLLSFAAVIAAYAAEAQVIVAGVSPASIVANYNFSWAKPTSSWGSPDFLIPGTFVQDTLMIVEDGTPGTNAQGHPISQEGCSPLTNNLTGKIAVIYRNTCEFGLKAKNAQDAGAVGVIIINRDPDVIEMGAGADGANVTIPVVMLGNNDGAALVNEMANGPVVVFMGNKNGLFANDIALSASATLIPRYGAIPAMLAQSGSEFGFSVGARIYNSGNQDQTNITINAKVTNPQGTVIYDETRTGLNIVSGDSLDVDPTTSPSFPDFSAATYSVGIYTLTYTITLDGVSDDYAADNSIVRTFKITDDLFSYAQINSETNLPAPGNFYRPSTNNQSFSICSVIDNPNASRMAATGLYFAATATTGVDISGEEIALYLYKWTNTFTDLNDANFGFTSLAEVASGFYNFPSDLQNETVYGAFSTPVVLEDNQRYLACAQTSNTSVYLGHESATDYTWNIDYYLQPQSPIESDGTYSALGFGADVPNSLAVKMVDKNTIGLSEIATVNGKVYPNPTNDNVTVSVEGEGVATIRVADLSGKLVANQTSTLVNGSANVNMNALDNGMYVLTVVLENGKSAQFNVVKK